MDPEQRQPIEHLMLSEHRSKAIPEIGELCSATQIRGKHGVHRPMELDIDPLVESFPVSCADTLYRKCGISGWRRKR